MGRRRVQRELGVAMNGHRVGLLTCTPGGELRFRYDAEWLEARNATPISLSLPLSSEPYAGQVVTNYFDNLLPDNDDIRRRMQGVLGAGSTRPFDLLAAAGADCVGALQLFEGDLPVQQRIDATPVSDAEIAHILRDRTRVLGMTREDDFRISIAGAQEKTALLWHEDRWQRPHGATPTSHVFKLPIGPTHAADLSDSVEIEWLGMRLAAAFDLAVAPAEIRRFEDQQVLVVERFDRRWSNDGRWLIRLPQEDACQACGIAPAQKYESDGGPGIVDIMTLLTQSIDPTADRSRFLKAVVVFWLLAAIDGHAKNFSIFLHPGGRIQLTPLYDVMTAHPLLARKQLAPQKIKMAMAVHGKNKHYRWRGISAEHWLATARRCGVAARYMRTILDDCAARIDGAIDRVANELTPEFPAEIANATFDGLSSMRSALR